VAVSFELEALGLCFFEEAFFPRVSLVRTFTGDGIADWLLPSPLGNPQSVSRFKNNLKGITCGIRLVWVEPSEIISGSIFQFCDISVCTRRENFPVSTISYPI